MGESVNAWVTADISLFNCIFYVFLFVFHFVLLILFFRIAFYVFHCVAKIVFLIYIALSCYNNVCGDPLQKRGGGGSRG